MAQIRHSAQPAIRLMSPRSARRWGQWFVFVWLAMWVSTALLPCCEVEAAIAAHEQLAHSDCGHPDGGAPDSDGGQKHTPCLRITAPAPASAESLAATGGNPILFAPAVSASTYAISSHPGLSLPIAYRAAPPPVAVYLRSLRLLI